jgi:tetratricopeptide (TPR) repeat protein
MDFGELLKLKPVQISLGAAFLAMIASLYFGYWYLETPREAILISVDEFPSELKPGFTPASLANDVAAHLREIHEVHIGNENQRSCKATPSIGPQAVESQKISLPVPLPSGPTPFFDRELKGVSLNLLKAYAMSLRARRFIEIQTIGTSGSQYQLIALLKEKPLLNPTKIGGAPTTAGNCSDYPSCVQMLSESILTAPQLGAATRLLAYYEGLQSRAGEEGVARLFETGAIVASSKPAEYYTRWGNAYLGLRKYDEALDKYQRALEIDSHYCPALFQRGYLFLERPRSASSKNDLEAARRDFLAADECMPNDPAIEANLAVVSLRESTLSPSRANDLLKDAAKHAGAAIQLDPQCPAPRVDLAIIRYRQGRQTEALQNFAELADKFPTSFDVFVNYGFLEYREYLAGNKDSIQGAIKETRKALELDRKSTIASQNLGFFLYEVDDIGEAEEAFRVTLSVDQQNADARAGLALIEFAKGNKPVAQKLLREAIAVDQHYGQKDIFMSDPLVTKKVAHDLQSMIEELGPH